MQTAYEVFSKVHDELYKARIRGHANMPLSCAFGVCVYWLRKYDKDMPLNKFLASLDDPWFVFNIRNLGQRRVELIKEYFDSSVRK